MTSSLNPSISGQSVTFTATISGEYGLLKTQERHEADGDDRDGVLERDTGCGTTTVTSGNPGAATCTTTSPGRHRHDYGDLHRRQQPQREHWHVEWRARGEQAMRAALGGFEPESVDVRAGGELHGDGAAGAGTPTGTVQFNIDGSAFGSPVTLASGSATSGSTTTLTVGTHTVTAVYSG